MEKIICSTRQNMKKRTTAFIVSTIIIFVLCVLAIAISNSVLEATAKNHEARETVKRVCVYLNIFLVLYGFFEFVKSLYKYLTYIEIHTDKICGKACNGIILQDFTYTYEQINDIKITKYGTLTIFTQNASIKIFGNQKELKNAVECYKFSGTVQQA